ncbi:MAG: hypothetical protein NT133_17490 [Alphaproteobacteria bacterium]|nr:hypothetical protein [Alphaproteobacteria bacterium]
MDSRNFAIVFDRSDPSVDAAGLRGLIRQSGQFSKWWGHIPGVYLVTSDLSAEDITDKVRRFTRDASMLVIAVDASSSDGWLPEQAWPWLRKVSTATHAEQPG